MLANYRLRSVTPWRSCVNLRAQVVGEMSAALAGTANTARADLCKVGAFELQSTVVTGRVGAPCISWDGRFVASLGG